MNSLCYLLIFAGCIVAGIAAAKPSKGELREILASHIEQAIMETVRQTKDWEDVEYRVYKQEDIDGDGIDDTLLIATFEHDNNSYQRLFVCLSTSPQKLMKIDVGYGKGDRFAGKMDIKNRTIIITGKEHTTGDAMCCPSLDYKSTYVIENGKIVEKK